MVLGAMRLENGETIKVTSEDLTRDLTERGDYEAVMVLNTMWGLLRDRVDALLELMTDATVSECYSQGSDLTGGALRGTVNKAIGIVESTLERVDGLERGMDELAALLMGELGL